MQMLTRHSPKKNSVSCPKRDIWRSFSSKAQEGSRARLQRVVALAVHAKVLDLLQRDGLVLARRLVRRLVVLPAGQQLQGYLGFLGF